MLDLRLEILRIFFLLFDKTLLCTTRQYIHLEQQYKMSDLPSHIEERFTADGRVYYVNHQTSTTSWERPVFSAPTTTNQQKSLPPGWEQRTDQTGRIFYVDHANGRTQWDFPTSASTSAPQASFQPDDFSNLVPQSSSTPRNNNNTTPSSTFNNSSASSTSRSWKCDSCGYGENLPESSDCVVCQTSRSGGGTGSNSSNNSSSNSFGYTGASSGGGTSSTTASSSISTPTSYNCSACTLQNDITSPNCTACNTARPSQYDNVVENLGIAASKQEEVSQLPSSSWQLDPPTLAKKDEPKECQHPGCSTAFGVFQRCHHCRSCGQVFCQTHSAEKMTVPGVTDDPQRVCDTCHEVHESGEKHNVWRYVRLLEHDGDTMGEAKRRMIYRAIADAFEGYGGSVHQYQSAISESQAFENAIKASLGESVDTNTGDDDNSSETKQEEDGRKPSSPTRMMNHMAASGHGLEIIHDYVKGGTAYGEDTQVELYRLFTVAAKAYSNESARGEEEVLTLMLDQLQAFRTLYTAIKSSNTPERALVHVLKPFSYLGRAPRVQSGARDAGVLAYLGNLLLSESVECQAASILALKMLQEDCLENRRVLTNANVPFLLCPLLQSSDTGVREAAAAALAQFVSATRHEEMDLADRAKEALATSDCIPTLRPLLQGSNEKLKMNALRVLHALSGSPQLVPKMIDADIVAPVSLERKKCFVLC